MSLLELPRELHLLIISYLGMHRLSHTYHYTKYHEARVLVLTSKKFAWLKNYRFPYFSEGDYHYEYYYIDVVGKADGPVYRFANNCFGLCFCDKECFMGYYFIHQGAIIGDHLIERSCTKDKYSVVYNGKAYRHKEEEEDSHTCSYCEVRNQLYDRLAQLDRGMFEGEWGDGIFHIRDLLKIGEIKITLDTSELPQSCKDISVTPDYLNAIEDGMTGEWESEY
jgi:hypothetical protein